MFTWFWLPGRRARQALASDRPEQAREVLEPHLQAGHRKALTMMTGVAKAFLDRGRRALEADHPEGAWDDLLAAEAVSPGHPDAVDLRQRLTKLAAATCKAAFQAGNLSFAQSAIARFKARHAVHPVFDWIADAAADLLIARELADQGDFAAAIGVVDRAKSRLPTEALDALNETRSSFAARYERARPAQQQLFAAMECKEWREVHRWAEDLLAVAPEHRDARQLRTLAWDRLAVGGSLKQELIGGNDVVALAGPNGLQTNAMPTRSLSGVQLVGLPDPGRVVVPSRLLLSIDGVGAYLLLLKNRISIGADANPAPIDVPVTAGLQRVHTEIVRDSEGGYILEPKEGAAVAINGEVICERRVLKSGDEVRLGGSFRFRFEQTNPLSGTALLLPLTQHRMAGSVSGVVMMASNLLVGPGDDQHLGVSRAKSALMFYTTPEGLGLRTEGTIRHSTMEFQTNALLPVPCLAETDEYHFRLEVYDPRS